MKTAGCRITFHRVDRAADAANHFLIAGTRFEFQARLVEGLKQFVGTLKEESAQLATAILGTTLHEVTSLR
jgi:hypothetical protein